MKKYLNGKYVEITDSEILQTKQQHYEYEKHYWNSVDYGDAINAEIRNKYSQSEEFAILRQKEEKPNEYNEYFAYCENCKAYVKQQMEKYKSSDDPAKGMNI